MLSNSIRNTVIVVHKGIGLHGHASQLQMSIHPGSRITRSHW